MLVIMTESNDIRFTQHAMDRALERWIDKKDIKRVIKEPLETVYDSDNNKFKCFGNAIDSYTKEGKYLMVVYRKFNTYDLVITSMWITQGGLKANGFNKI